MAQDITKEFIALRDQYIEGQFGRLNDVQVQAVCSVQGPLLILAGAGSGKTTVLVNRIANIIRFGSAHGSTQLPRTPSESELALLRQVVEEKTEAPQTLLPLLRRDPARPWNVLAITFTNKAAGELKERLNKILGGDIGGDVNASTFHSACVRMLRRSAESLGFPKSFTIYDSDDQLRAMKEVYKQLNVDDKFIPVKSAIGQIGRMKDQLISPKEALECPSDTKAGLIAKIYNAYAARLRKAGAMDFDDLIYYTVRMLQENEEERAYYQNRFRYVLVDEYQDTSVAQFQLVRLLAGGTGNVCVVGDDDQSIYRFRGATIENILNFEQNFPGAKVIRLEQNYRSTSNILNAANGVIANNAGRKGKTLWTQNGDGDKVHFYEAESEQDEASHIASVIGQDLRAGARLRDHAVLYRMNAQSGPIETYFARAGIPYKIVGGQRFYDRKEVKDILSYMAIVANPADELRLRRILNVPARKIGDTTVEKMADIAAGLGVPLLQVVLHAGDYPSLSRASGALAGFAQVYTRLQELCVTLPLDLFVREALDVTGYKAMLTAQGEEGETRMENLGQLISSVKTYADQGGEEASLSGFLEEVALISDIDSYNEDSDVVVMMTLHAAKGLEFDTVFLVGLEDGIFPGEMSKYSEEDMEEERRLCYVGITRAKKQLYISASRSRMLFGQTKRNPVSRFVEEIDPDLLDKSMSEALEGRSSRGWGTNRGFGGEDAYSSTVPRGRSGYSGYSGGFGGGGRSAGFGSGTSSSRSPYLNGEYNRGTAGFGGGYTGGFGGSSGSAGYGTRREQPARRPETGAKAPSGSGESYQVGDIVDHKVFGRGRVLKVTPVAGDHIVEIQFEKVGIKKTMANYAPIKVVKEE